MSTKKPLGQLMMDIIGTSVSEVEKEMLQHPFVGGVILFTRNYENKDQLAKLIHEIRSIRDPILIAVDQEGGRVQRFREGFTSLAPISEIGSQYQKNVQNAKQEARDHAKTMATEIKALDIDFSFTPVLDVDHGLSEVIGSRSFHQDPKAVVELAADYIDAMHDASMPATGKHFPGHGGVMVDSHLALPVDQRDFDTIYESDMRPFRELAGTLDAMMSAHIIFPAVDANPVTFSATWLKKILRDQLKFQGVVFSDCLTMKATEKYGSYAQRAKLALDAGCDMILVCNNQDGAQEVLSAFGKENINPVSVKRLMKMLSRS